MDNAMKPRKMDQDLSIMIRQKREEMLGQLAALGFFENLINASQTEETTCTHTCLKCLNCNKVVMDTRKSPLLENDRYVLRSLDLNVNEDNTDFVPHEANGLDLSPKQKASQKSPVIDLYSQLWGGPNPKRPRTKRKWEESVEFDQLDHSTEGVDLLGETNGTETKDQEAPILELPDSVFTALSAEGNSMLGNLNLDHLPDNDVNDSESEVSDSDDESSTEQNTTNTGANSECGMSCASSTDSQKRGNDHDTPQKKEKQNDFNAVLDAAKFWNMQQMQMMWYKDVSSFFKNQEMAAAGANNDQPHSSNTDLSSPREGDKDTELKDADNSTENSLTENQANEKDMFANMRQMMWNQQMPNMFGPKASGSKSEPKAEPTNTAKFKAMMKDQQKLAQMQQEMFMNAAKAAMDPTKVEGAAGDPNAAPNMPFLPPNPKRMAEMMQKQALNFMMDVDGKTQRDMINARLSSLGLRSPEAYMYGIREPRKRNCLTLETKIDILRKVEEKKTSRRQVARDFGIPHSTMMNIIRDRERYWNEWLKGGSPRRRHLGGSPYSALESKLYEWFSAVSEAQNVTISGKMLQAKAIEIAMEMGDHAFMASNGWLHGFKRRHGIVFKSKKDAAANDDSLL